MFLNIFFHKNIVCIVNDAKKIWVISVRTRLFVLLNYQYVLNKSYENNISLVTINTPSDILQCVQYLITSLNNPQIFVLQL